MDSNDRLAEAINSEPVVFMDCTMREITVSALFSSVIGIAIFIFLMVIFGFFVGAVLGLISIVGITYLALNMIQGLRQKYYEGWLAEKLFLTKLSAGLSSKPFLLDSKRYGRGARRG